MALQKRLESSFVPISLSGQVVHNGGRGDRLSCARWALDQTEGALQHCFHSVHLHHKTKKIHVISDRTKSKRPGSKQNSFQSCNTPSSPTHLGVVKVREALSSEAFGQLALDDHILYLMSQQFVVDVTRH